jgi:hypothetical protein
MTPLSLNYQTLTSYAVWISWNLSFAPLALFESGCHFFASYGSDQLKSGEDARDRPGNRLSLCPKHWNPSSRREHRMDLSLTQKSKPMNGRSAVVIVRTACIELIYPVAYRSLFRFHWRYL